jgi:hypothetical protein
MNTAIIVKSGLGFLHLINKNEMIVIKAIQKLYGWNNSNLVSNCVMAGAQTLLINVIVDNPSSSLTKAFSPVVDRLFNEENMARIEEELQKEKANIDPDLIKQAQEHMAIITESLHVFQVHRKRGRPANEKRPLGRPIDRGVKG